MQLNLLISLKYYNKAGSRLILYIDLVPLTAPVWETLPLLEVVYIVSRC